MTTSVLPNSSGENDQLQLQNWDAEVESIIQNLWGNQEKTDALKTIWSENERDTNKASKQEQAEQQCKDQSQLPPPGFLHGSFPVNSGNCPSLVPFNNYTSYCPMPENALFRPTPYIAVPPNPVLPVPHVPMFMSGDVEPLSQCFVALESLDLDIKACEQLMGISSLSHPVQLPTSYDLKEVERLAVYSEKQNEFFTNFSALVEDRFKWEEKRLEAVNKKVEMWNQLRGKDWKPHSFEGVTFSIIKSITERWIKVNKIFLTLLNENGKHQLNNLCLFPIYFKDLVTIVGDAKTAVWTILEKIKMTQGIPTPNFEGSVVALLIPKTKIESSSSSNASTSGSDKTDGSGNRYRRRRGKNYQRF